MTENTLILLNELEEKIKNEWDFFSYGDYYKAMQFVESKRKAYAECTEDCCE